MSAQSLPDHQHLHRDTQYLLRYADALTRSGSKAEDDFWEARLIRLVDKVLTSKEQGSLELLFEFLGQQQLHAHYEILVSMVEGMAESLQFDHSGQEYEALLISLPITAWTRYQLPHGALDPAQSNAIKKALFENVLNPEARVSLFGHLLSFDQLPANFGETRSFLDHLLKIELGTSLAEIKPKSDQESFGLLADARFILAAVMVPKGDAIFSWQLDGSDPFETQVQIVNVWQDLCSQILGKAFTGCQANYWLPNAFYANNREADKHMRPLTIKAAVTWLQTAAQIPASDLIAIIAQCGDDQVEEYRIGFNTQKDSSVIYGAIWPILSPEEIDSNSPEYLDAPSEIASLLKELGVDEIRLLPGIYLPETCDDCGAPSFPNSAGELVHPDLPEEINLDPLQLH